MPVEDPGSEAALAALPQMDDPDDVLDVLLNGWEDDFLEGRAILLRRMRAFRAHQSVEARRRVAQVIYRELIAFGEEGWEMRFVHLAVESRDTLLY